MHDSSHTTEDPPVARAVAATDQSTIVAIDHNGRRISASRVVEAARAPEPPSGLAALHSVRRRWPQMIVSGVVCGAVFAAVSYFLFQEKYRSYASLRVHSETPRLAFQVDEAEQAAKFDVYKRTQRELVLGDDVLMAALRSRELTDSPIIQEVAKNGDPVLWLRRQIQVDFPGDAEIMLITMEGKDALLTKNAVNAVLDAFVANVINAGKRNRTDRLAELRRVLDGQEDRAQRLRSRLESLTKTLGSGDADALSVRQQVAIQRFAQLQTEHTRVQFERLSAELQVARLADQLSGKPSDEQPIETSTVVAADAGGEEASGLADAAPVAALPEIEALIQRDAAVAAQRAIVAQAVLALEEVERRVNADNSQLLSNLQTHVAREKQTLAKLEDAAREVLLTQYKRDAEQHRNAEKALLAKRYNDQKAELQTLVMHENLLAERLSAAAEEADKIGTSSVNVELTRKELDRLESINDRIGTEIETLAIEVSSGSRVEELGRAREPKSASSEARIKKAATFGVFGFLLPCVGLFFLDHQRKHVNSQSEIVGMSSLRPLGAMPILPRTGMTGNRHERGTLALREAVDGIRTVLIREAELSDYRVIQITSAVGGEAKTTFATQLARSLARAHRRTVLIDLDLRRPSVHEAFGRQLASGVCEVLRGEVLINDVLRTSDEEWLSLLFAGKCDRSALTALTKDEINGMLTHLREQFEFVIVDTSPVLPVVDSLLVAQHVDAVILTAMRDVSRGPQLREARDRLWQVGANVIGSVVTTKESRSYYDAQERYIVL